jgi:hypothetical protein
VRRELPTATGDAVDSLIDRLRLHHGESSEIAGRHGRASGFKRAGRRVCAARSTRGRGGGGARVSPRGDWRGSVPVERESLLDLHFGALWAGFDQGELGGDVRFELVRVLASKVKVQPVAAYQRDDESRRDRWPVRVRACQAAHGRVTYARGESRRPVCSPIFSTWPDWSRSATIFANQLPQETILPRLIDGDPAVGKRRNASRSCLADRSSGAGALAVGCWPSLNGYVKRPALRAARRGRVRLRRLAGNDYLVSDTAGRSGRKRVAGRLAVCRDALASASSGPPTSSASVRSLNVP